MKSHETPEESLARAGIVEVSIGEQEAALPHNKETVPDKTNVAGGKKAS
jgi:hypothetical protein